ncbi:DUF6049 family protein [Jongsikchunia kroppenstedtii]|uniref:DUF6049 family protein n=1 Tax=Jongsikchunia kroppenstedtii TaxID=1121721 RepID=UPI003F852EF0
MRVVLAALLVGCCAMLGLAVPANADRPAAEFLHVVIDTLSPTTVTTTSSPTVTVTGTITNFGDRTVHDVAVRLQRAPALDATGDSRAVLVRDPNTFDTTGAFHPVSQSVAAGAKIPFSVSIPLSAGGPEPSLQISRPGVYPLLVNVNGTPDYGSAARLDDARTLLPVLGLPADSARAQQNTSTQPDNLAPTADGSVAPDISSPTHLTLLWPFAASPQVAPGGVGDDKPTRLISDNLATSFAPGGRLDRLLSAAEGALPDDDNNTVKQSLCLAIDPDLLVTAQAMVHGYTVPSDPDDSASRGRTGHGGPAAEAWLNRMATVAGRADCVVALPYAQADLNSVTRVHDSAFTQAATGDAATTVDTILNVKSVQDIAIPTSGALDWNTLGALAAQGTSGAMLAAPGLSGSNPDGSGQLEIPVPPYAAADTAPTPSRIGVQSYDPAITTALAAMGDAPTTPANTPADQRYNLAHDSAAARRADAIGAIAYAALRPSTGSTTPNDPTANVLGRSQVVLPPAVWNPSTDDANAILQMTAMLLDSGLASSTPLPHIATRLAGPLPSGALRNPNTVDPLPQSTVDAIGRNLNDLRQFQGSLVNRPEQPISPQAFMSPLFGDLLRATTRNSNDTAAHNNAVDAERVAAVQESLVSMREQVSILNPGGRYTLASERSPLLLVIRNDLPVPMRVQLDIQAPRGMTVGDVGVVEIPPRGTRQIQLPTKANSSRTVSVKIGLASDTGVKLGQPIELSVHSNAYGQVLFIITICAAVLLVLLAGRRLWHRFRGEPDPADADRPEPDARERKMADDVTLHQNPAYAEADQTELGHTDHEPTQTDDHPDGSR